MPKSEVVAGATESVKRVLQAGGFTTLEVAMRTGISHRAAFGALLELERQGVVDRSGNPGDWSWRLEGASFDDESRHFRALFDHIPVVTYHYPVPYSSSEYYISPQVEALLGYPREAWSTPSFWEGLLHPDDGEVARYSEHSISTGTPFTAQYRVRSQDGRWIWIQDEATLATSPPNGKPYWLGVWVDVTSFRTTEEELTSSIRALNDLNDERMSLIGDLVASQEKDRRFPDEIGDDPIQVLATSSQVLELLGSRHFDPDLLQVLERAAFAIRESTRRLRQVSFEGQPTELERVGLGTAIELYGKSFGELAAIDVQVTDLLGGDVPPWVANPVLLVATEVLSCVLVHPAPRSATVRLEKLGAGVLLTVDDGAAGFEAEEGPPGYSGLRFATECAEGQGGWLRIVEGARGSQIESWIPG